MVAAEGAKFADGNEKHCGGGSQGGRDEFGHLRLGGIGSTLASEIEKRTGFESRSVVLGHIQRGGSPSAFDRVLATRYGLGAIDMVHRGEFGQMAALRGNKIISIPLAEAIASNRKVDKEILDAAIGILDKLDYKVSENPELATSFFRRRDLPRLYADVGLLSAPVSKRASQRRYSLGMGAGLGAY